MKRGGRMNEGYDECHKSMAISETLKSRNSIESDEYGV
jgi:hypothetical protein